MEFSTENDKKNSPNSAADVGADIPIDVVIDCWRRNEQGDGILYAMLHRGQVLWCADQEAWFHWAGHYWRRDVHCDAALRVAGVADQYRRLMASAEDAGAKRRIIRRIDRLLSVAGQRNTLTMAAQVRDSSGQPALAVTSDQLDSHRHLIATPSGVIDLRTGRLRPGRPQDMCTAACPTAYAGLDVAAARWERFLAEVLPDAEVRRYLQLALGHAMLGQPREHYLTVFLGAGRNGKTLLQETIQAVVGPALSCTITPHLFTAQKYVNASGPTPEIIALHGRRLAFASELSARDALDTTKIKKYTGGDTLVGRAPHGKHEICWRPTHSLFLATNAIPAVAGDDPAGLRRMRIIDFPRRVVADRPPDLAAGELAHDPTLEQALLAEAPGILAWLVRGAVAYQVEGLHAPAAVLATTADWAEGEDLIGAWLADRCIDDGGLTAAKALVDDYTEWMETHRMGRPMLGKAFFGALARRVPRQKTATGKCYRITLRRLCG